MSLFSFFCPLSFFAQAGQERFDAITQGYFRNAVGAIIVYDVCSRTSFDHVDRWFEKLRKHAHPQTFVLLVGNKKDVDEKERRGGEEGGGEEAQGEEGGGGERDVEEGLSAPPSSSPRREVSFEEGLGKARLLGASSLSPDSSLDSGDGDSVPEHHQVLFREVSALTGEGVEEAFVALIESTASLLPEYQSMVASEEEEEEEEEEDSGSELELEDEQQQQQQQSGKQREGLGGDIEAPPVRQHQHQHQQPSSSQGSSLTSLMVSSDSPSPYPDAITVRPSESGEAAESTCSKC